MEWYTPARVVMLTWAEEAPERVLYGTRSASGRELRMLDMRTGADRLVTDKPIGLVVPDLWSPRLGALTPDGEHIVRFARDGDDVELVVEPFSGGEGVPLAPDLPSGSPMGFSVRADRVALGMRAHDTYIIAVVDGIEGGSGGEAHTIIEGEPPVTVASAGLSADGELLALAHADSRRPRVAVVDSRDGRQVTEVSDGPGNAITAVRWSPVEARLALVSEVHGDRRAVEVWDVTRDERTLCQTRLPGDINVADWWPDGRALLLTHDYEARRELFRYDLETGDIEAVRLGGGYASESGVRPDGRVWYVSESSSRPPVVREWPEVSDAPVFTPPGDTAPAGTAFESLRYLDAEGDPIHAFLVTPDSEGPHPLLVLVHGGPAWHCTDHFDPFVQALVGHGIAVFMPNYPGSTGYGKAFQARQAGDPGFAELAALAAGADHLADQGIARRGDIVLCGSSWGGYVTLLGTGTQPDLWAAGIAYSPIVDVAITFRNTVPQFHKQLAELFDGAPDTSNLYRERSPSTYVEQVVAPVQIFAAADDGLVPRAPTDAYVSRLRARGVHTDYRIVPGGHNAPAPQWNADTTARTLDFLAPILGTAPAQRDGSRHRQSGGRGS